MCALMDLKNSLFVNVIGSCIIILELELHKYIIGLHNNTYVAMQTWCGDEHLDMLLIILHGLECNKKQIGL